MKDVCEEGTSFVQASFDQLFQCQLDLKNFVALMLEKNGTSWINKLSAQALFPNLAPIVIDIDENQLRDAFVTSSVNQYAENVDSKLVLSIERSAGNVYKINIKIF